MARLFPPIDVWHSDPGIDAGGVMQPSQEWFDHLIETTQAGLRRYVRRFVACPDDTQEILQEAYLKVFCTLRRNGPDGHNPAALLFTAARNIAISRLRHQKVVDRSTAAVTVNEELRVNADTTEHVVSRRMQHRALVLAVNSLPPKCRSVFVLRMMHGMSQRAIAEELGIAVSTVEKHLANGLRLCKSWLHENDCANESPPEKAGG